MDENTPLIETTELILAMIVLFLLVLLSFRAMLSTEEFLREWRYLTGEINRSSGHERRRWISKRRRLLLSLLPFVRY